ncbi:MAG: DNA cytosine methyltransferase [Prevotella sp.]|nr:DNA cytosine methyltransferase [Prevotella sp.]
METASHAILFSNYIHRQMKTYTIEEVAREMGMTLKAVRKFVASGELRASRRNNTYAIAEKAFEDFKKYISKGGDKERTLELEKQYRSTAKTPSLFCEDDFSDNNAPQNRYGDKVRMVDIIPYWDEPGTSKATFVDLFCGAGGLSLGLEMAGLNGICGLDFFKEAGKTYQRNFKHPFVNGDIRKEETKKTFYDTVKEQLAGRRLSLVAGGFPCQGFSMSGNRIVDDPRNSLYKELVEIVSKLRPDFVVCENVKGLRNMLDGKVEKKILDDFKAIGYDMRVTTLCAADYLTPQKRERVVFIGNRKGLVNCYPLPLIPPDEYMTTEEAIGDLMDHPADKAFNHVPTRHSTEMARRIMETPEGKSLYKGYSDSWKKCPWDAPSCTIKENHGGVNLHPKLPRVLTAREMARLQSFPDEFIFEGPKSKQLVQIGNAVPPLLGKAVGLAVRYAMGDFN